MDDPLILGVILAGGKGERLGGRKALRPIAGAPMIAHVARAMPAVFAVAGDAEAASFLGVEALSDPPGAARGPLAGVCAGLRWASARGASWLATAPCDAPLLLSDVFSRLRRGADEVHAPMSYAVSAEGAHPLCALWSIGLVSALEAAMRDGAHPSVQAFAAQNGGARVSFEDADVFLNVNTPDDLARAENAFSRRSIRAET